MTTTTHTPASLLSLYQQDPRKLDALAAEVVMGYVWRTPTVGTDAGKGKLLCAPDSFYGKHPHWVEPSATAEIWHDSFDDVLKYSASLDAAALLEARLAERGLRHKANSILFYHILELFPMDNYDLNEYAIDAAIHATAAQRTIAAILAAGG